MFRIPRKATSPVSYTSAVTSVSSTKLKIDLLVIELRYSFPQIFGMFREISLIPVNVYKRIRYKLRK